MGLRVYVEVAAEDVELCLPHPVVVRVVLLLHLPFRVSGLGSKLESFPLGGSQAERHVFRQHLNISPHPKVVRMVLLLHLQ